MEKQILMKSTCSSFEDLYVGQLIPVPEQHRQHYINTDHGVFMYVQHDHFISDANGIPNPNHGKLAVRNTQYRNAMKAFVRNFDPKNPPTHLKVIRMSQSGKSIITDGVHQ